MHRTLGRTSQRTCNVTVINLIQLMTSRTIRTYNSENQLKLTISSLFVCRPSGRNVEAGGVVIIGFTRGIDVPN